MVPEPVKTTVCVVGLGYVGTPLAEAFAGHVPTIGFDIDKRKVELPEAIRHTGTFEAVVRLNAELTPKFKVKVTGEET